MGAMGWWIDPSGMSLLRLLSVLAVISLVSSGLGAFLMAAWLRGDLVALDDGLERLARGDFGSPVGGGRRLGLGGTLRRFDEAMTGLRARLQTLEEKHALEKAKVETLVYNIPDGIVMTNLRGEVLYVNTPAMSMLGIRPEEVAQANKGLFEIIRQDPLRRSVQNILEKHTHSEVVQVGIPGADGRGARFYHTSVTLFSSQDNKEHGVILMLRDVTLERELAAMKEDFFHSIAHDLRAPIFAVQGYLRLLEKSVRPDEKLRGYFDAIYQSCEKLTLFIQDILDTHRLEAGQLSLEVTSLEPLTFVQKIKKLYEPVADEKGISLEAVFPQDYPGAIEGDERLLERVFNNLISNALKFTPRGGRIRLCVTRAGPDHVEFSVADTGLGIPQEKKAMLFEKFHQIQGGQEGAGFGLGLNICRRIVHLHGGTIWVETQAEKGSEFIFRIPVKQKKNAAR